MLLRSGTEVHWNKTQQDNYKNVTQCGGDIFGAITFFIAVSLRVFSISITTEHARHIQQENRAVARKPRNAAFFAYTQIAFTAWKQMWMGRGQPWNYFLSISTYVTTIPQRHRRTDRRTDDLPWQYRALRSIAR